MVKTHVYLCFLENPSRVIEIIYIFKVHDSKSKGNGGGAGNWWDLNIFLKIGSGKLIGN